MANICFQCFAWLLALTTLKFFDVFELVDFFLQLHFSVPFKCFLCAFAYFKCFTILTVIFRRHCDLIPPSSPLLTDDLITPDLRRSPRGRWVTGGVQDPESGSFLILSSAASILASLIPPRCFTLLCLHWHYFPAGTRPSFVWLLFVEG